MINSTTSTDRAAHAALVTVKGHATARELSPRSDLLSTENAAFLRAELARQPEIRAEVLERAQALAANPDYPSNETIKKFAGFLLNSPDLSDDQT